MQDRSVLVSLVVLLIIGGAGFYFFRSHTINSLPDKNLNTQNVTPPSPSFVKTQVLTRAKITLPKINTRTVTATIPSELKFLQRPEGVNIKKEIVVYENKKTGYTLSFDVTLPVQSLYKIYTEKIYQDSIWKGLYGSRGDTFGVLDIQNKDYQGRISMEQTESGDTHVSIELISL